MLQAGLPAVALSLRLDATDGVIRTWLARPRSMWAFNSGYSLPRENRGEYVAEVVLPEAFDGFIFVRSSSPTRANARTRERFEMDR